MNWLGSLTIDVAQILTIIAMAISVYQLWQAAEQTRDLKDYKKSLFSIKNALSTRFLGQFPIYNEEIAKLIDKASHKVIMFYDLPGYGLFSNYKAWFLIHQAIQRKIEQDIHFSVTIYAKARRMSILKEQFYHKGTEMEVWKSQEEIKLKMIKFLKNYGEGKQLDDITHETFHELIENAHLRVINDTFRGQKINEVVEHIPLYIWMIDEKEAIISIPTFSSDSTEYGFYTSDKALITALIEMVNRYSRVK